MARAYNVEGERYAVSPPEPVGDASTLIERLVGPLSAPATVLVGFDFPIGLPREYATLAGLDSFREALGLLGRGRWSSFFEVSDDPVIARPFGPKANLKNGLTRDQLARALGLASKEGLYRLCDRKTSSRPPAEALFFTRFSKQVGRAAISGWRDVLVPRVRDLRLWPFDGSLAELLETAGVVIAEIYPAEALQHLAPKLGRGVGQSKAQRSARQAAGRELVRTLPSQSIELTSAARYDLELGCRSDDDFDAIVGLFAMILTVQGKLSTAVPDEPAVLSIEGWILGQALPRAGRDDLPLRKRPEQPGPSHALAEALHPDEAVDQTPPRLADGAREVASSRLPDTMTTEELRREIEGLGAAAQVDEASLREVYLAVDKVTFRLRATRARIELLAAELDRRRPRRPIG